MKHLLILAAWTFLWAFGGLWLARAAFRLQKGERLLVGLALGLALDNLLANLLARVLPTDLAFWMAAGLTFVTGLLLNLREGKQALLDLPLDWRVLAAFLAVTLAGFAAGRGYQVFDEAVQLPMVSLMAAGDIPPHFALDRAIPYDYHYYMLLFAAQAVRIGSLHVWTALDLVRGLATGLAVCLAFQWTRRITNSRVAGLLGSAFILFATGTRWLLAFLPDFVLKSISGGVSLIGSGAASGNDLVTALSGPWAIEGNASLPFPFAYANGVVPPGVITQFIANGLIETALILALLLTFKRWRSSWKGGLASAFLLSAMALLTEAGLALEIGGWVLVAAITAWRNRSLKLPPGLWVWLVSAAGGHLLGALQGGALLGILSRMIGVNTSGFYQTIGFKLVFPPSVVSTHLGILSLGNPGQILIALLEMGPLLLALPLMGAWGWKALRAGRWYEAALVGEAFLSFGMLFVQFTGSEGVRNTSRLYRFMFLLVIFSAPLGWNWMIRRKNAQRWLAGVAAGLSLFGGLVLFGAELPAFQRPVYTYFIDEMDVRMSDRFWNKLDPDTLVFDPVSHRGVTVLGRFTDSNTTWFDTKPEWNELFSQPLPQKLRAAGYSYAYLDNFYFRDLSPQVQQAWSDSCVIQMGDASYDSFWRRLYDIKACK
jgi:hypothetical protein